MVLPEGTLQREPGPDRQHVGTEHGAAPTRFVDVRPPRLPGNRERGGLHRLLHQGNDRMVHRRGQAGDERLVRRRTRHQRALERQGCVQRRDEESGLVGAPVEGVTAVFGHRAILVSGCRTHIIHAG